MHSPTTVPRDAKANHIPDPNFNFLILQQIIQVSYAALKSTSASVSPFQLAAVALWWTVLFLQVAVMLANEQCPNVYLTTIEDKAWQHDNKLIGSHQTPLSRHCTL